MIADSLYESYLALLLAGRSGECRALVGKLIEEGVPVEEIYEDLFKRSLYRVGTLWEANRISVAREHLATSITQSLFSLTYPEILKNRAASGSGKVIISCGANEFHQIGGRMITDVLELAGWDGFFLGANTPESHLIELLDQEKPDLVGLSLSLYTNMGRLLHTVKEIKGNFSNQELIVGGQAFRWGGAELLKQFPATEYIPDMRALKQLYPAEAAL